MPQLPQLENVAKSGKSLKGWWRRMSVNGGKVLSTGPAASASGGGFLCHPTSQARKPRLGRQCSPQAHSGQEEPHLTARQSDPGAHTPDHQAFPSGVSKLPLPRSPFRWRNLRQMLMEKRSKRKGLLGVQEQTLHPTALPTSHMPVALPTGVQLPAHPSAPRALHCQLPGDLQIVPRTSLSPLP